MYNAETARRIANFYVNKGLNAYIVCGLLANALAESGLDSRNIQNSCINVLAKYGIDDAEYIRRVDAGGWEHPIKHTDYAHDGCGVGLYQLTYWSRKQGHYDFCKSINVSIGNETAQLEWSLKEINAKPAMMEKLKKAQSPEECALILMLEWEKPADMNNPKKQQIRKDSARMFYEDLFNGAPAVKVLALDAGHGDFTSGKRCPKALDPNETREHMLNDRIADKIEYKLSFYDGIRVERMDDTTGRIDVPLQTRTNHSDEIGADAYLSIHHNGAGRVFDGGGISVFCYPLARNIEEATEIYNRLVKATGLKGNRAKPINPTKDLHVIRETKADAYLIEHGFMDSRVDFPIIMTEEFAETCAQVYCDYFVEKWNLKKKDSKDETLKRIDEIKKQIAVLQAELAGLEASL